MLGVALALAGCGSAAEEEAGERESAWSSCRNAVRGFEIDYPREWHTDSLRPADECRAFHPEPFELMEGTDCCPWALEEGPPGSRTSGSSPVSRIRCSGGSSAARIGGCPAGPHGEESYAEGKHVVDEAVGRLRLSAPTT